MALLFLFPKPLIPNKSFIHSPAKQKAKAFVKTLGQVKAIN
jgi:hypothetical protein